MVKILERASEVDFDGQHGDQIPKLGSRQSQRQLGFVILLVRSAPGVSLAAKLATALLTNQRSLRAQSEGPQWFPLPVKAEAASSFFCSAFQIHVMEEKMKSADVQTSESESLLYRKYQDLTGQLQGKDAAIKRLEMQLEKQVGAMTRRTMKSRVHLCA